VRIAVTGAGGTLGRAVVAQAAERGHEVVALDRVAADRPDPPGTGVTNLVLDTTDADALRAGTEGCDALVHLAAYINPYAAELHAVHNMNVTSSYNALRAAAENGIRRVCLASSVNAIGGVYSEAPRYDYFPLDEEHPTYAEDPYSLSKWVLEEQARSIVRRHRDLWVASLRFHALRPREVMREGYLANPAGGARNLWGYSPVAESAAACLAAVSVDRTGAEVFYLVASDTASERPSEELWREFHPDVPVRAPFDGRSAFIDSSKARDVLGWSV